MSKAIEQSVADKPLQWLLVAAAVGTAGYFAFKDVIPSRAETLEKNAETSVGPSNPFSYSAFLTQKIPVGTSMLRVVTAGEKANLIYKSLDTWITDSPDIIIGVFNSLKNKVQVAQVAQAFYQMKGRDILVYLKNGNKFFDFGTGGLSDNDYQRILTIVSNKPKF